MASHFFKLKHQKAFYVLVAVFMLFFGFRIASGIYHLSDSYEYLDTAKRISNLSLFSDTVPHESKTKRPFIYPLFLSFLMQFPTAVIIFIQTLIGLFTLYITLKIIEHFNVTIRKIHILLFVFTPSLFIYTQLIMSEWLVLFFITALFWLLIQKWHFKTFAYIQTITVLLAFTKPVFYPLVYINFIFFTVYFIKHKIFSFWIFMPLIVMQSYMLFLKSTTGYYHFSSMQNINLINYNLFYFKSKSTSEADAEKWLTSIYSKDYDKKSFSEKNKYLGGIAKDEIKAHFFNYSLYHFYTSIRGMFDPGRFDLMTFFKKENGNEGLLHVLNTKKNISELLKTKFVYVYLTLIPIVLVVLIKWFYAFKYILSNLLDFKLYYIFILFTTYVLISGPVNCSRYIMPFQGVLIIFAILGMTNRKRKTSLGHTKMAH